MNGMNVMNTHIILTAAGCQLSVVAHTTVRSVRHNTARQPAVEAAATPITTPFLNIFICVYIINSNNNNGGNNK